MHSRLKTIIFALLGGAVLLGQFRASSQLEARMNHRMTPVEIDVVQIGPDVIVSKLGSIAKIGTSGGITAYAISTTSCNIGDSPAIWLRNVNEHPLIAQNMYRLSNGRIEHIGMSWVKHSFCAVDEFDTNTCGVCQPDFDCDFLAIGCADTYSTGHNSAQTTLGPRSEVNASSGFYPYPYQLAWQQLGDVIYKRLQVHNADLDPTLNSGARYFFEANYLTTDEQFWNSQYNNASYRECFVGIFSGGGWNLAYGGPSTVQKKTGIEIWSDHDPEVTMDNVDVLGDGRFIVGNKVTDNGDGTWHYEYAIYNQTSDRNGRSLAIDIPECVTLSNIDFHDVDYHSGELYSGADWLADITPEAITWSTEDFASNANANALRWGSMYNFRFDADAPPVAANATLGLFRPGATNSIAFSVLGPQGNLCPADIANDDSMVNVADLLMLLVQWSQAGAPSDIAGVGSNCPDGTVSVADLLFLLINWGPCP